jgi:hypothetical protein
MVMDVTQDDTDCALLRAREIFLSDATDELEEEIETLLPALIAVGYAEVEKGCWGLTDAGRERADQLEPER